MEIRKGYKNHAGFHAELLTFARERGIKFFLFQSHKIIASLRALRMSLLAFEAMRL